MARSRIQVSGALDTWIRELPCLGTGDEVGDAWDRAVHRMLLEARAVTHVITGQLFSTSYAEYEHRGSRHTGSLWWPAQDPDTGYHYAQQEFGLPNIERFRDHAGTSHDAPSRAYQANYASLLDALGEGLEAQVRGWR